MADFEQLIGDSRRWLRKSHPRPHLTNPIGSDLRLRIPQIGVKRYAHAHMEAPHSYIGASEVRLVSGSPYRTMGRLGVVYGADLDSARFGTFLTWRDSDLYVRSPHAGSPDFEVPLDQLTGVLKETVYDQLNVSMARILDSLK